MMKAMVLSKQAGVESSPLRAATAPKPRPKAHEVLVKVDVCGVCRTDLHIIEGELPKKKLPLIPGHQVVGTVEELGPNSAGFKKGDRVGVTWINSTCGRCEFCKSGRDNLCDNMKATGYDTDGGYAEYVTVAQEYAYKVPENLDDVHVAPLFCAGIIGYRAFKLSGIRPGGTLALFGFGSSAHIITQIARRLGCNVLVATRSAEHRALARKLGASWAGSASDAMPERADAAVIMAPAGSLVINALANLKKGGRVSIADIYMTAIPGIDYNRYLYNERSITSVTNYTKADIREFLDLAGRMKIKTEVKTFNLDEANTALLALKQSRLRASAVLKL